MKRWQIIFGIGLILLGVFALIEVLTGIDLWGVVFPLILIGIGILLILRPKISSRDIQVEIPILGDVRKKGAWQVGHHEIWLLVGSTRLDFTNASFPQGEGKIKLFGFVNDIKIILPEEAGRIAEKAGVKKLYLIHYPPGVDEDRWLAEARSVFSGEVVLAKDLMVVDFH